MRYFIVKPRYRSPPDPIFLSLSSQPLARLRRTRASEKIGFPSYLTILFSPLGCCALLTPSAQIFSSSYFSLFSSPSSSYLSFSPTTTSLALYGTIIIVVILLYLLCYLSVPCPLSFPSHASIGKESLCRSNTAEQMQTTTRT